MPADASTLRQTYTRLLEAVYEKYCPEKRRNVPKLMERYEGQWGDVYAKAVRRYVFQQPPDVWKPYIVGMYARFNPKMVGAVEGILDKYEEAESSLFRALCDKYLHTLGPNDPPLELGSPLPEAPKQATGLAGRSTARVASAAGDDDDDDSEGSSSSASARVEKGDAEADVVTIDAGPLSVSPISCEEVQSPKAAGGGAAVALSAPVERLERKRRHRRSSQGGEGKRRRRSRPGRDDHSERRGTALRQPAERSEGKRALRGARSDLEQRPKVVLRAAPQTASARRGRPVSGKDLENQARTNGIILRSRSVTVKHDKPVRDRHSRSRSKRRPSQARGRHHDFVGDASPLSKRRRDAPTAERVEAAGARASGLAAASQSRPRRRAARSQDKLSGKRRRRQVDSDLAADEPAKDVLAAGTRRELGGAVRSSAAPTGREVIEIPSDPRLSSATNSFAKKQVEGGSFGSAAAAGKPSGREALKAFVEAAPPTGDRATLSATASWRGSELKVELPLDATLAEVAAMYAQWTAKCGAHG